MFSERGKDRIVLFKGRADTLPRFLVNQFEGEARKEHVYQAVIEGNRVVGRWEVTRCLRNVIIPSLADLGNCLNGTSLIAFQQRDNANDGEDSSTGISRWQWRQIDSPINDNFATLLLLRLSTPKQLPAFCKWPLTNYIILILSIRILMYTLLLTTTSATYWQYDAVRCSIKNLFPARPQRRRRHRWKSSRQSMWGRGCY